MQTHRDDDHEVEALRRAADDHVRNAEERKKEALAELVRELEPEAERLTAAGENQITAGAPGEHPLAVTQGELFTVVRMPDDPSGLVRASVGEHPTHPGDTSYVVFRGDPRRVYRMLRAAARDVALLGREAR